MQAWLSGLERLALGPNDVKEALEIFLWRYENNQRTDRYLGATLMSGKDADGVVWISLIAQDRPKIQFKIRPSEDTVFKTADGSALSPADASKYQALAWVQMLRHVYGTLAGTFREPTGRARTDTSTPARTSSVDLSSIHDDDVPF
jgi:hypothetical protein